MYRNGKINRSQLTNCNQKNTSNWDQLRQTIQTRKMKRIVTIKQHNKGLLRDHFTKVSTKSFQRDLDHALKSMTSSEVIRVLHHYDILLKKETKEFLEAYYEMMEGWQKPLEGTVIVGEIKTRDSKCIACVYGKEITVYKFQYKHSKAKEPYNYVVYGYEFGMLYDIRDGILHDLSICNAFLSKTEMQKL